MDVDKLKTKGPELCEKGMGRESAVLRHTTYRRVELWSYLFQVFAEAQVNHDDFVGQKPVFESVQAVSVSARL